MKIWLWFFFIVISIISIAPRMDTSGLEISYINSSSPLSSVLNEGDVIYTINNEDITMDHLEKNYTEIEMQTNKGPKFFVVNGTLGIDLKEVSNSNLNFGLDIKGGVRSIIKPVFEENFTRAEKEDMSRQIISTLQTRINAYGLQETSFRPVWDQDDLYIQIEISGGSESELEKLLEKQGKFEAKIPLEIEDGKVSFSGETYQVPDKTKFNLSDIQFVKTNESYVEGIVYTGNDVKNVYIDPQHSWLKQRSNGYEWGFQVLLEEDAVDRFSTLISDMESETTPGQSSYLKQPIKFYLDGKLMDQLRISSTLKTNPTNSPAITGFSETQLEADQSRIELQSILRSGSLPTEIEIEQMSFISPKLGTDFLRSVAIAGLAAILVVTSVVFIRYRKIKLVLPMVFVSLSEVLIILGASVFIGWTIDLAALAGIIAAVGTGIDSQIIILDETIEGKEKLTLKEKLKRAFFMIFGAAGTTIGAMLPLMVLGFGLLRGFAITTSIGVLIGALITRPAFGKIIEKIAK